MSRTFTHVFVKPLITLRTLQGGEVEGKKIFEAFEGVKDLKDDLSVQSSDTTKHVEPEQIVSLTTVLEMKKYKQLF